MNDFNFFLENVNSTACFCFCFNSDLALTAAIFSLSLAFFVDS